MIVDAHIHIWAPEYIPSSMRYNWARLAAHRRYPFRDPDDIFPKVTQSVADPDGEYTIAEMDQAGVDASVSMLVDYAVPCKEEAEVPLVDVMESYSELQRRYEGRFYAFATVDPHRDLIGRGLDAGGKEHARIDIPYRYEGFEPDQLERAPTLGEHTTGIVEPLRGEDGNREAKTAHDQPGRGSRASSYQ